MKTAAKLPPDEPVINTDLIVVPPDQIDALFQPDGAKQLFDALAEKACALVEDVDTVKGRKAIASIAAKVSRSKTLIDDLGKARVAPAKALIKETDTVRKWWRDNVDALKLEVRKPLTEWEEQEQARIESIRQRIAAFSLAVEGAAGIGSSAQIAATLDEIRSTPIDDDFGEYVKQAQNAKEAAVLRLEALHAKTVLAEREAAEAKAREEALAKAQAEAEAAEIARKAREEAKADAEAQIEQAKRAEIAAQLRAEQAEKQRLADAEAAKQREAAAAEAAAQAERDRIAAEAQAKAEADRQRQADADHRRKINTEAMRALMHTGQLDPATARTVITLLAKGAIPHCTINY